MGSVTRRFWQQFFAWERPAQIAFVLALLLLVLMILALAFSPVDVRQPALIGLFGLVIMLQAIFMWANRGMVTPYTQAQRLYVNEDFEAACTLLEELRAAGKADMRALTLLGNAYRQQGDIQRSEAVLLEALDIQPNHHYPLYGFGRTLLVQGRFAEAAQAIEQALALDAPLVVRLDLAEAYYRNGQYGKVSPLIDVDRLKLAEPHRQLLSYYLLHRMDSAHALSADMIAAGLPYWQAQAERFAETPYGQALIEDIRMIQQILEEA